MSTFTRSTNGYTHNTSQRHVSAFREALPQILAVSIKNMVLVGFGMTLGFPTILIAGLEDPNEDIVVTVDEISWLGSINLIFVPIGCLISGPISQKIGRRYTMQLANIPLIASWLLFRFSTQIWQIYLGLSMTGFLLGCIESSVITYVAEITTPKLRGILASTGSISFIIGVLLEFLLGTFFTWRDAALISIVIPIIAINLLIMIPESPYWLLTRRKNSKAQINLAWFRGWIPVEEVEAEYKSIYTDLNQTVQVHSRNEQVSNKAKFLRPFGLVVFVFFVRHFNGITNLQTYAVEIFETFRTPLNKYYTTALLGAVEVLGCCVCVVFVHVLGKRVLTFVTLVLCGFCLIGAATYATVNGLNEINSLQQISSRNSTIVNNTERTISHGDYRTISHYENRTTSHGENHTIPHVDINNWIPTGFLLAFAFFANAGIRILPWLLTGEIFPTNIRSCAVGISIAIAYIFGFASNKLFFNVTYFLTLPGTLFAYASLCFLSVFVLYFILPETEGKSLIEISQLFVKSNGVDLNSNRGMTRMSSDLYGINFDLINNTNEVNSYKKFTDIEVPL